jgi:NADH-quinone oxidoreductase subunit J
LSGELIVFFVLALFTLGGAVLMLYLTKVVHMVVALAFTFLSIAGLYVLLHAEFIAFAQVLIYGGAVSIIMLFGIMLTSHNDEDESQRGGQKLLAGVGVGTFFVITIYAILEVNWVPQQTNFFEDNTTQVGVQLFTKYVIPFELTSVLLLVALVGAIILAKRDDEPLEVTASREGGKGVNKDISAKKMDNNEVASEEVVSKEATSKEGDSRD